LPTKPVRVREPQHEYIANTPGPSAAHAQAAD
jgi:hypothetical protein